MRTRSRYMTGIVDPSQHESEIRSVQLQVLSESRRKSDVYN